jgi:hypothetical protein
LDANGDVGRARSLAVDGHGGLHVSYLDHTNERLKYVYKRAGSAPDAPIILAENVAGGGSLVVDPSGRVHVAYCDEAGHDLKYAVSTSCAQ